MKRFGRMAVLALFAATLAAVPALGNVQLIKAETYTTSHYGYYMEHLIAIVKVKNVAYDKQVRIWGKTEAGHWAASRNGVYVGPAEDGWEIWRIDGSTTVYSSVTNPKWANPRQFAIKYEADGQTWWDNNQGSDYSMGLQDGEMLGNNINVLSLYGRGYYNDYAGVTVFYGQVLVRNLAYDKQVTIVYSTDGWNTVHTAACNFVASHWYPYGSSVRYPNVHGCERWGFSVDLPAGVSNIEYVVSYDVNGSTWWDNNRGRNYEIDITH